MSKVIHIPLEENCFYHLYNRGNKTYRWSSYRAFLDERKTSLKRRELLDWFGGKESFERFHNQSRGERVIGHLIIEDY